MTKEFDNKVVLVTGGGSGIGRATAILFAKSGADVAVADWDTKAGEETVEMINKKGGNALFIQADISKSSEVEAMIQQTTERYGKLDLAVNNAGIEGARAGVIGHSEEMWDKVISVNLKGIWLCMKYELKEMQKQKAGSVVNVSSAAGLIASAGTVAYTASKHGVVGLTKSAALEFAPKNIRINAVCPGFVRTNMLEGLIVKYPDVEKQLISRVPTGRIALPEEVAKMIVWLCSEEASFVTGAALPVDGGLTLL